MKCQSATKAKPRPKINVHDWTTKVPLDSYQSHVIHPTALDGVFHLSIVALSDGAS